MKRSKNLLRKGAALAAMSTVLVSQAPLINAFAYGEADVSQSTFKQDTCLLYTSDAADEL